MDEVDLLQGLVSIYSPTGQTQKVTEYLQESAKKLGLTVTVDVANNIRMAGGSGPKHMMFLCHVDTVPGELKVHQEGPFLHGRGSVDAKGCLAAAMMVASRFRERANGKVEVVAVVDEEGPSNGIREVIKGQRPDCIIVGEPSGWEGITIGYKGAMRLRCRCKTPKFHSGQMAQNSAEACVELWGELEAFCIQESGAAEGGSMFDAVSPTLLSMNTTDDGIQVCSEMVIDIRVPPGCDPAKIRAFIEMNKAGIDVEISGEEPAALVEKNNELVKALIWAIRRQEGEPSFKKKTGTSDMNITAATWQGVPIAAYGPGDSSLDHSPEERIDVREYRKTIMILKEAVERILQQQ
jgi:LysW-gamma-L-lysine carboxypeptidase